MRCKSMGEPVSLERQPNRDHHAVHLLLRDAEDECAAVGHMGHESLVHQLAERLAHGRAARPELRSDPLLDQTVAGLDSADSDRLPDDLHHVLGPMRAAPGSERRGRVFGRRVASVSEDLERSTEKWSTISANG